MSLENMPTGNELKELLKGVGVFLSCDIEKYTPLIHSYLV